MGRPRPLPVDGWRDRPGALPLVYLDGPHAGEPAGWAWVRGTGPTCRCGAPACWRVLDSGPAPCLACDACCGALVREQSDRTGLPARLEALP